MDNVYSCRRLDIKIRAAERLLKGIADPAVQSSSLSQRVTTDPAVKLILLQQLDPVYLRWAQESSVPFFRSTSKPVDGNRLAYLDDLRTKLRRHLDYNFVDHKFVPNYSLFTDGIRVFKYLTTDFSPVDTVCSDGDLSGSDTPDNYQTSGSMSKDSVSKSQVDKDPAVMSDFHSFLLKINPDNLSWFDLRLLMAFSYTVVDNSIDNVLRCHLLRRFSEFTTADPTLFGKPYKLFGLLTECLPPSCQIVYRPLYSSKPSSNDSTESTVKGVVEGPASESNVAFWSDAAHQTETLLFRVEQQALDYAKSKTNYDADDEKSNLSMSYATPDIFDTTKVIHARRVQALLADVEELKRENPSIDLSTRVITDSGCPLSMTNVKENLRNRRKCKYVVRTAKKDSEGDLRSVLRGDYYFSVRDINGRVHELILKGTLYVPNLSYTLIGTYHLNQNNHRVILDYPYPSYVSVDRKYIVPFQIVDGLYLLPIVNRNDQSSLTAGCVPAFAAVIANQRKDMASYTLWHTRLCHAGASLVIRASDHIQGMSKVHRDLDASCVCHACQAAKSKQQPRKYSLTRPMRMLEWWSVDVSPMMAKSLSGAVILSAWVDHLSRWMIGFPNASRTEHLANLQQVQAEINYHNTRHGTDYSISRLQTDGAPEYETPEMMRYYNEHGIKHDKTGPYIPRQNGIVERNTGTIVTWARACLHAACMPEYMWPFAVLNAIFIYNRLPHMQDFSGRLLSPYEIVYKQKPTASDIRVFGCLATMHMPRAQQYRLSKNRKLAKQGIPCVYVGTGYYRGQKCWLGYSPLTKKIYASDSAKFHENFYPCRPEGSRLVEALNFYTPNIDLPEKMPAFTYEDLQEMIECRDELPIAVMEGTAFNSHWGFEADGLITNEELRYYHSLQDIDLDSGEDRDPTNTDLPEVEPPCTDLMHDEWARAAAQNLPGSLSNFDPSAPPGKRLALRHPYSTEVDKLFSSSPMTMNDLAPEIDVKLSKSEQKQIDNEMSRLQSNIKDLLNKMRVPNDSVMSSTPDVSGESLSKQEAVSADSVCPAVEFDKPSRSVTFVDPLDDGEESLQNAKISPLPTADQYEIPKVTYLDWNPSMLPLLNRPIQVLLPQQAIEYTLTTGEHTLVPVEVVVAMVKNKQQPPTPIASHDEPLGRLTRSKAKDLLKNDFNHFDSKGKSIGTLALITRAVGYSKFKKMKAKISKDENPKTWAECLESEDRDMWIEAVYQELLSLHLRGTYTLAHPSPNDRVYSSRLVTKKKRNAFTNAVKGKARIVVQGYTQIEGIDYHDTFSPTVGSVAVRTMIACSTWLKYKLFHIDITTAFLSADIDQPFVYVRPPKGLEEPDGRVWRLNKALYGLKQSPRLWYKEITRTLRDFGFKEDPNETHLWRYMEDDGEILLCLYVDDLLFAISNNSVFDKFFKFLSSRYPIGESGPAKEFLHVCIDQNDTNDVTTMHQIPYVESLLTKFSKIRGFTNRTSPLPLKLSPYFQENLQWCNPKDHTLYREIVGSLLYLAIWTRPDISFAVGILSRFLHRPAEEHLDLAFRVLGYLKRKPLPGLVYSRAASLALSRLVDEGESLVLYGYADASWNDNEIDRRSTSGFVMLAGSTAVSWQSKRQEITALSTAEAEFISAARCGQEACHLRMMLEFLGFPQHNPTVIFEDNNACIQMAQNAANTSRTKHIDLRKYYLKELERRDIVQLIRVSSHDQHADFLTKQVAPESHSRHHRFVAGYPRTA